MEVLHDLRSRCGAIVKWIAAMAAVVVLACGDATREGLTADSAVLQTRDSLTAIGTSDSIAAGDSTPADALHADTLATTRPTLVLLADSASGDVLYRRKGKCLSCHGLAGKGLEGLGANLQDTVWLHGDGSIAFLQRTIIEGIARPKVSPTVMPAFGTTLTPEEIYHIAAYVYTLSHPGSAVADTTVVLPDTVPPPVDTPPPPPLSPPAAGVPPVFEP
jgi:mono/diheme cytochrome c family protein